MALIACPDCGKEISPNAPACIHCGAPIATAVAAPKEGDTIPYTEQEVAVMLSKKMNTSHVFHLIMSIITLGGWVIIWVIMILNNEYENKKIDRKIAAGKKVPAPKK